MFFTNVIFSVSKFFRESECVDLDLEFVVEGEFERRVDDVEGVDIFKIFEVLFANEMGGEGRGLGEDFDAVWAENVG